MTKPRIWLSNTSPKKDETVRVRALIEHRMETGLRSDQSGKLIDRNIVTEFTALLNDDLLFTWQPETAIAQNPYIEFTFVARHSGELKMTWVDDNDSVVTGTATLSVDS